MRVAQYFGPRVRIDARTRCNQSFGIPRSSRVEEQRLHLVFDQGVKGRGVTSVLRGLVRVDVAVDGPAVRAVEALRPPSVEHARG